MIRTKLKPAFLSVALAIFMSGCMRVDTDPQPVFHQIHEEISHLSGQEIYWDSSLHDCITTITVDELLEQELTEDLAVQIALLNNKNLQAIYESLGIAKAQLAQAGLLKNPVFSLSYRFSTVSSPALIDMGLLQNFLEILLIPLKRQMAQAELDAIQASVTTQILDVMAEAKTAFFQYQAAEQIWELKKQVFLAAELSYEAAKKLLQAGNVKDLQVSLERSLYEEAKLDLASWEVFILEAREKLNILMGLWGHQIQWRGTPKLPQMPDRMRDFKDVERDAARNSIDLRAAFNQLCSTAARFGINTTKWVFPQFDAGVSSEREGGVWFVGPAFNLAIPLFDFGKANSAKARAQIMQEWNRYTALAIEIRSKARTSRFTLLNAFRQSRYLEKIMIPLAEEITYSTLLQNNAMQMGVFDLLLAKRQELEKKIQSIQLQLDYWVAEVTMQTLLNGHVLGSSRWQIPMQRNHD